MTVEELRASVIRHSAVMNPREEVDALLNIVAAQEFERGRAEGAGGERKRIKKESTFDGKHFIVPELVLELSEEEYPSLDKWVEEQGYGLKP